MEARERRSAAVSRERASKAKKLVTSAFRKVHVQFSSSSSNARASMSSVARLFVRAIGRGGETLEAYRSRQQLRKEMRQLGSWQI
jgi:hypothetical protein